MSDATQKEFRPAFDMPETYLQAVAVIKAWGSPLCMTFSAHRAKRCSDLLSGSVVGDVFSELDRATAKFPTWPTDPLHALAVLGEEVGELNKAMLQLVYEPHKTSADEVRTEAIQAAAMALRLAMSLDRYEYRPGPQHEQEKPAGAGE